MTHEVPFDSIEPTDEALAVRAAAGDVGSFDRLARRYQTPLMHYLTGVLGDRHDAEDVLQETLVRVFDTLARFDARRALRPWVFTIAYRLAMTKMRRGRLRLLWPSARRKQASAADDVERAEARTHLWDTARRALTSEQFTALWLFYVDDAPVDEIGRVLGRSGGSVKTMLHRARQRLGEVLKRTTDEDRAARGTAKVVHDVRV